MSSASPLPQDARGYFMLPQMPEESGYYTYGTPPGGRAQYARVQMLNFIFKLEHGWSMIEERKIGIGNISLAQGKQFPPHRSHRSGLEVDIRPIRKDGSKRPVRWSSTDYDQVATQRLVDLIWQTGMVKKVGFNDPKIANATFMAGHDDHLHVEVRI
ncbi:MAG: penicillin-insensitive murein endopeptidase [Gammaproteobacteria bacterium]|nr:penicillin-insensitive murein endopeptidase [Gammaproteobacteria bacterium]MBU0828709.1 penicillin-insensitive murein endopeptidase [Gammaproteobacteria bacterium]MBU1818871.1 penicillin-insensitive murein endopeptidase [Gammaproteobacteria bacterium]